MLKFQGNKIDEDEGWALGFCLGSPQFSRNQTLLKLSFREVFCSTPLTLGKWASTHEDAIIWLRTAPGLCCLDKSDFKRQWLLDLRSVKTEHERGFDWRVYQGFIMPINHQKVVQGKKSRLFSWQLLLDDISLILAHDSTIELFTITAAILARSLANFYCQ